VAVNEVVNVTLFLSTFLTLFVIMDPPGLLPVFLALTGTMTTRQRRRAAVQATATSLGVILVFVAFGQIILDFLHISLPALQMSGGLLLLLMAMELLTGRSAEPKPGGTQVNVALVPLGTPLIAGPGAIVAVMLAARTAGSSLAGWVSILSAILAIHVVLWLTMRYSIVLFRILGEGGISLLTRIAGLLLAAIAVQLMADAVFAFLEGR